MASTDVCPLPLTLLLSLMDAHQLKTAFADVEIGDEERMR